MCLRTFEREGEGGGPLEETLVSPEVAAADRMRLLLLRREVVGGKKSVVELG